MVLDYATFTPFCLTTVSGLTIESSFECATVTQASDNTSDIPTLILSTQSFIWPHAFLKPIFDIQNAILARSVFV